jgi:hypothetical protein
MLSEHERQELVGLVAKECGTVLSPDDPVFASVVMSERVLEHAASAVALRLARHLEASFAAQEDQVAWSPGVGRGRSSEQTGDAGPRPSPSPPSWGSSRSARFSGEHGHDRRALYRTHPA